MPADIYRHELYGFFRNSKHIMDNNIDITTNILSDAQRTVIQAYFDHFESNFLNSNFEQFRGLPLKLSEIKAFQNAKNSFGLAIALAIDSPLSEHEYKSYLDQCYKPEKTLRFLQFYKFIHGEIDRKNLLIASVLSSQINYTTDETAVYRATCTEFKNLALKWLQHYYPHYQNLVKTFLDDRNNVHPEHIVCVSPSLTAPQR